MTFNFNEIIREAEVQEGALSEVFKKIPERLSLLINTDYIFTDEDRERFVEISVGLVLKMSTDKNEQKEVDNNLDALSEAAFSLLKKILEIEVIKMYKAIKPSVNGFTNIEIIDDIKRQYPEIIIAVYIETLKGLFDIDNNLFIDVGNRSSEAVGLPDNWNKLTVENALTLIEKAIKVSAKEWIYHTINRYPLSSQKL